MTYRYREQARSHMVAGVFGGLGVNTVPCGSELARDDGNLFNINAS